MPNQVTVDFIGNAKPLATVADAIPAKMAQSGDAAGKAFANSFSNQTAQAYAAEQARLFKLSEAKLAITRESERNRLLVLEQAAEKAGQIADKEARRRGRGSQREGAAGRLNLARQGADVFTQLGSGQDLGIIAIQQGPQILDAAAQSGFKLASAMQAVASFAAAYGATIGVAGAGLAIIYKITSDIADAEKQKLKFIENGAIASNKAILAKQAEVKAYQDAIAAQEHQFQLSNKLEGADAKRLKELLQIAEVTGKTDDALKIRAALLQNPEIQTLDSFRKEYNQRQDFEKQLRENQKKNEEAAARERIEKIKEVAKATEDFFRSASQRANADNPFFKILSDAQELEKQINKLDPAFQKLAKTQASLASANSLFAARIENALGVSDLRQQANFFRNGQKGETSDDLLRRLGFNPDQFKNLSDAQKANFATQFGSRQAVALGRASVGGNLGGVNIADLAIGAFRNAQQKQSTEETVQQKLDRQFKELSQLSPANDTQRAAIDRRIAALSQGVDPTALRRDTRNQIADALSRNADNLANQQGEATRALIENTNVMRRLTEAVEKSTGVTLNTASQGVKISLDGFGASNGATAEISPPLPNDTATGFAGFGSN